VFLFKVNDTCFSLFSGVHLKPAVFELQAIAVSLDPNQMPIQVPKATM
jgi:hypothetical protein